MTSFARSCALVTAFLGLAACRGASVADPGAPPTTTVVAERAANATGEEAPRGTELSSAGRSIALTRFAAGDQPVYPEMSRRLHEEGSVELSIGLLDDGSVKELAIARSSGHPRLDDAALDAARTWRFHPRTGGGGVERIRHRVVFRLTD